MLADDLAHQIKDTVKSNKLKYSIYSNLSKVYELGFKN
jgi:hypothetical protein